MWHIASTENFPIILDQILKHVKSTLEVEATPGPLEGFIEINFEMILPNGKTRSFYNQVLVSDALDQLQNSSNNVVDGDVQVRPELGPGTGN